MKKKSVDQFMFLVGKCRAWFADEEIEVSDYTLGRMAVRLQDFLNEVIGDDEHAPITDIFLEGTPEREIHKAEHWAWEDGRNKLRVQQRKRAGLSA